MPWSTSHPGSGVALGTLDHPITALSHQTHPTAECISQGVLCVTQGMGMAPGAHPDHASPRVSHRRVRHPQQHLLPGEEPVPQSLEVHVRVGHDAGVEVHEVQALEPAWGEHSWGWGGSGVPGARRGGASRTCSAAPGRPAAPRPGCPGPPPPWTPVRRGGRPGGGRAWPRSSARCGRRCRDGCGHPPPAAAGTTPAPRRCNGMGSERAEPHLGQPSPPVPAPRQGLSSRVTHPLAPVTSTTRSMTARARRPPAAISAARARPRPVPPPQPISARQGGGARADGGVMVSRARGAGPQ